MIQPINPYRATPTPQRPTTYSKETIKHIKKIASRINTYAYFWIVLGFVMIIISIAMMATGYGPSSFDPTLTTIVVITLYVVMWIVAMLVTLREVIPMISNTNWIFSEPNTVKNKYVKIIRTLVVLPIPYLSIVAFIMVLIFTTKFSKALKANKDKLI